MTGIVDVRHLSRVFAVFIAGAAIGASYLAPAMAKVTGSSPDAVAPAAVHTRAASCHGFEFQPIRYQTPYDIFGNARVGGSVEDTFVCDPRLPHRAVVTRVQFTLMDYSLTHAVHNCALVRSGLTPATAQFNQVMAVAEGTGVGDRPGPVRKGDSTIEYARIDNTAYAYWLQCNLTNGETGIYGANVTYRITTANG